MNYTLFISDLHCDPSQPEITTGLQRLLTHEATQADALYILGDFFEVWLGDDDHRAFAQKMITTLKNFTDSGIPTYIMAGNRDFLIGKKFCALTGCQMLQDPTLIDLYGHPVVITHGDFLCTDDKAHCRFRRFTSSRFFKLCFLALPISIRERIAKKTRRVTINKTKKKPAYLIDVNKEAVEQLLEKHHTNTMIHGHTHKPAIHELEENKKRIVLGAWHTGIHFLQVDSNFTFTLKEQPYKEPITSS